MIYRLLYKLLHDSDDIRNRVGSRIFAENAPAPRLDAYKRPIPEEYIVLRNFSGSADYHLEAETDCANPTVQIDCHATPATAAESLYQLVRNRLSGFSGVVDVLGEGGTEEEMTVHECRIIRPGMTVESPRDASDQWSYNHSADFEIYHSQSVPTLT